MSIQVLTDGICTNASNGLESSFRDELIFDQETDSAWNDLELANKSIQWFREPASYLAPMDRLPLRYISLRDARRLSRLK
jgi:hypothetical protein